MSNIDTDAMRKEYDDDWPIHKTPTAVIGDVHGLCDEIVRLRAENERLWAEFGKRAEDTRQLVEHPYLSPTPVRDRSHDPSYGRKDLS